MPLRKKNLKEICPGLSETLTICWKLWPDEMPGIIKLSPSHFRIFLNQKTGLAIPGTARGHFKHWLSKLREMAS